MEGLSGALVGAFCVTLGISSARARDSRAWTLVFLGHVLLGAGAVVAGAVLG